MGMFIVGTRLEVQSSMTLSSARRSLGRGPTKKGSIEKPKGARAIAVSCNVCRIRKRHSL
jgi:hypothetical protein